MGKRLIETVKALELAAKQADQQPEPERVAYMQWQVLEIATILLAQIADELHEMNETPKPKRFFDA